MWLNEHTFLKLNKSRALKLVSVLVRRQNIQHNGIQHNDTQRNDIQHNDTQHYGLNCDTKQKQQSA